MENNLQKKVELLAQEATSENPHVASILYVLVGSMDAGHEAMLSKVVIDFGKNVALPALREAKARRN